jgi:nucleoside-diphosphate-sugar epimerase
MSRVHVTGANGFIGGAIMRKLRDDGHQVTGSDREGGDGVRAVDLRDRGAVLALIEAAEPEVVVHAGAISGAMVANGDPALVFDVNVGGTLNVAEAMRRAGCRRMVFMSSNAVYADRDDREPVEETSALGAEEPYGASKIAAEAVLATYAGSFGLDVLALRTSSVFGVGRTTPYLISDALDAAKAGLPVIVTDRRANMRQFVHVRDVVSALALGVARQPPGFVPLNITGGTYLSEEDVVRLLFARQEGEAGIAVVPDKGQHGDGRVGPLSLRRAEAIIGYRPEVDVVVALAEMGAPITDTSAPAS